MTFAGKELVDENQIRFYSINQGDTILLSLRIKGGMITSPINSETFNHSYDIIEEKAIKIPIKKKMINDSSSSHFSQVEISAHNSTIGNDTSQNDKIILALPFDDSMQEKLQNSFNSLLKNNYTINNQVQSINKELSNFKEIIHMDMEGL